MGKKFCPVCGGEDIDEHEDGLYTCVDCGNSGKKFPEKELIGVAEGLDDDLEDDEMPTPKEKKLIKDVKKAKKFEPKAKVKVKIKKGKLKKKGTKR